MIGIKLLLKIFLSYDSLSFDGIEKKISIKNIEKVIKLKNILKNNVKDEIEFISSNNTNKLRKIKQETEDNLTLALHRLGPPGFLKTKFKSETVKKYQIVNGKYFGC